MLDEDARDPLRKAAECDAIRTSHTRHATRPQPRRLPDQRAARYSWLECCTNSSRKLRACCREPNRSENGSAYLIVFSQASE